jgi:type II secretory pathway pseudopilin PulG
MSITDTTTNRRTSGEAGFSLVEVLTAMGIMLVVLAGTFSAMTNAMRIDQSARNITTMNGNLRAAMDLVVRDMTQVGQGLPIGRAVGIPNGAGATAIGRPGPAASPGPPVCAGVTPFPITATLQAVTVGPNLGPAINGVCTDVVTTLAVDSTFEGANVSSISAARVLTIYRNGPDGILGNADDGIPSDNPDVLGDNPRVGDLLMLTKGDLSALVVVSAVAGQTITVNAGASDPLGINQTAAASGTLNWYRTNATSLSPGADPTAGAGVGVSRVSRLRMITYFVNTTADPTSPRLMRQIGSGAPMAVAFELEAFAMNYDIADGVGNPAYVEMNAADIGGTGRCSPNPCSASQIRKANVTLSIRSQQKLAQAGYFRNSLTSQVALRSLAFVDRY